MRTFEWKGLFIVLILLNVILISVSTPAIKHSHSQKNTDEREKNGAFSPRDKNHKKDKERHSEFHHEAILGSIKDALAFDNFSEEESKKRLTILLKKMDLNHDGFISQKELHSWILRSFRRLSEEESEERFEDSDINEDEKVTWQEYLADSFGMNENEITEVDGDKLVKDDKAMFEFADKNKDGALNKTEFLFFSHPEEHPDMYPFILKQTLDERDLNNDGFLDFHEFIGSKGLEHDKEWLLSEKTKFDSDYDKDKDGRLNSNEIILWMIPSNSEIAEDEVSHLFEECDDNKDNILSFEEILNHHDTFVGSEATDYGEHLHELHMFQDEL